MEEKNYNKSGKLKDKVLSGLVWTFGERILAQGVSFILSLVLARLLMPQEYGKVAIILVFINIAEVFVSSGFGEALIQKKNTTELDYSTVFYCSFIVSIVISALLFCFSPTIESFYKMNNLDIMLRVLAIKIPVASISTIQHAYVSKHMMFKKFFFSTFGGTAISGVIGIVMAYSGFGVWALIAQYLINTIVDTLVLFIIVPWRPRLMFSVENAKELLGYGWKLTVASLINTGYVELRSLIIGKKYNSSDLAYYNRGNQFPSLIITNIDTSIGKVAFPAMAHAKDNLQRLKSISRRSMKVTSYIIFPLMIGLIVVAKPLIVLLLTEKWLSCAVFLQISCVFYMCQPIQTTNWQIIKAVGRSDLCFKLELVKKFIGILLILISMNYGVYAISIAAAFTGIISMIINMIPNKKLIGYSIKDELFDIFPALFAACLMGIAINFVHIFEFNPLITILVQTILGIIIYILLSILFKIDSFYFILNIIKSKFSNKKK